MIWDTWPEYYIGIVFNAINIVVYIVIVILAIYFTKKISLCIRKRNRQIEEIENRVSKPESKSSVD